MGDYFLADDLSGALDAGGAFHHAGRSVRIAWSANAWLSAGPDEVVAFTTETRNAPPAAAADAVSRAIAFAAKQGGRLVYKKIDSTLRGPVAAELMAVRSALPAVRILFAPANPRVGRTVRDGVLLVNGVPVAETEFGRDPVSPVRESSIRALLGAAAAEGVSIADTEVESDLQAAVERMQQRDEPWVGVGSGALARPIAALCAPAARRNPARPAPPAGPILMVCGSAHPGNRGQAEALAREVGLRIIEVRVTRPDAAADAARTALDADGAAALLIEAPRGDREAALHAITAATVQVLTGTGASRMFVTGGETAFAICGALGVPALRFCAELEPGLSVSEGWIDGRRAWFAIKPGGFGDPQTWLRAWRALQGE